MNLIYDALQCPVCGARVALANEGKSLMCEGGARGNRAPKRHCFDFSASGYVNFAPPAQSLSGDSREAIRSRTNFLEAGYYDPISRAVCEAVEKYAPGGLAVDAGCGEGYYTAALAECVGGVIGFDLSKTGIDAAAKRARRKQIGNVLFGVAGIYSMPLADDSVDAVVSLFAPCAEEEFYRILRPGGILVAVGAGEDHLLGLKRAVYDEVYKNTRREDLPTRLAAVEEKELKYQIRLDDPTLIRDLFSMTPYYYRTGEQDLEKLRTLESLETEVHVFIHIYKKM